MWIPHRLPYVPPSRGFFFSSLLRGLVFFTLVSCPLLASQRGALGHLEYFIHGLLILRRQASPQALEGLKREAARLEASLKAPKRRAFSLLWSSFYLSARGKKPLELREHLELYYPRFIHHFKLPLAPYAPLSWKRAGSLYRRYCLSCHGIRGQGDGPWAGKLEKRPGPFSGAGFRHNYTPLDTYNFLRIGAQEKGMPSFRESLSSQSLWELSYFLYSLGLEGSKAKKRPELSSWSYSKLALHHDRGLLALLQGGRRRLDLPFMRRWAPFQGELRRFTRE